MVNRRRIGTAIVALASALALGCGDYAHRNPYDPETETRIVITGPDTLWSIGEPAQYTATVSPAIPGGLGVVWGVADPGDGRFVLGGANGSFRGLIVGTGHVTATVGRHTVSKRVVVRQRAARVFICPAVQCSPLQLGPVGTTRQLPVGQYDAFGTPLDGSQPRSAVTYTSDAPSIVAIVTGSPTSVTIQGVGNGTTWVRARLADWTDSVRVTVGTP